MVARRGTLPTGTGLHARPASSLVTAITDSGRPVRVGRPNGNSVDGRSVLRVLGLDIRGGEAVELSLDAEPDEAAAHQLLDDLLALIATPRPAAAADAAAAGRRRELAGVSAARGWAVGPVARLAERPSLPPAAMAADDPADEEVRAIAALRSVAADLRARAARTGSTARAVLEAGALVAEDPALYEEVRRRLRAGRPAAHAIQEGLAPFRDVIAGARGDLPQRDADLNDVGDRAVAICLGQPVLGLPDPGWPYILVADDLAPADAALLDPALVLAIVTARGGPTGHTAILAREHGIPAVVGCLEAAGLVDGEIVAVRGTDGIVIVEPRSEELAAAGRSAPPRTAAGTAARAATADGHRVALLANLGSPDRAAAACRAGAEGVGLLRTEFCFHGRSAPPTVAEQVAAYGEVAGAFAGARVVIRLLDAGADKPLAYLRGEPEPNPALGVRGLRALRAAPDVLTDQLAAIAETTRSGVAEIWAMAPMVATAAEALWFAETARAAGVATVGVMIEIPSAAIQAREVLAAVDFASIGTNDLAQYAFAADRSLPELAELNDAWQPALLRLVELAATAGGAAGRPVGVCGEAAGDPPLAAVLVGLGVESLSMAAASLAAVRELLSRVELADCRRLAAEAAAAPDASAARATVLAGLADLGVAAR